jgi:DNA-binding transcriptional ArsR family regulator
MSECDKEKYFEMAEKLKAIAHPVRLCIVRRLSEEGQCNVSCMLEKLQIHQPTLSHHLMLLRTSGIIEGTRQGNEIYYSIKDARIAALARALLE